MVDLSPSIVVPGPIGISTAGFDLILQKFIDGKGYIGIREGISPAAGGQFVVFRLRNPRASAKTLIVTKAFLNARTLNFFTTNPIDSPAKADFGTADTVNPKRAGQTGGVGVLSENSASTSAPGTGLVRVNFPAAAYQVVALGWILPANSSVDFGWISSATTDITDNAIEWYEE